MRSIRWGKLGFCVVLLAALCLVRQHRAAADTAPATTVPATPMGWQAVVDPRNSFGLWIVKDGRSVVYFHAIGWGGDVPEGDIVADCRVSPNALATGKFDFTDKVTTNGDVKNFASNVPAKALSAGRVVLEFTDHDQPSTFPYMAKYTDGNATVSNTGQLRWDATKGGHFTINTDGTKAVVGFVPSVPMTLGNVKITLTSAAPSATAPAAPPALSPDTWIGKSADWTDPANWSTGQVPTDADVAVFDSPAARIANQPDVGNNVVKVGGIAFKRGGGVFPLKIQGDKTGLIMTPPAAWVIKGGGVIHLGRGGIRTQGTDVIYPTIQLGGEQTWAVGGDFTNFYLPVNWADTTGTNPTNLVLCGNLVGAGPLIKNGDGKLYYANNASPSFTGGVTILNGWIYWAPTKLTGPQQFSFGAGPIRLDGGYLAFGPSMCKDRTCVGDLTNAISVGNRGGRLMNSQEGPTNQTPDTHFSGAIDLGGQLLIGHVTVGSDPCNIEVLGPVTLNQQTAATPLFGLNCADTATAIQGVIRNGPGVAGNPLILNSPDNVLPLANPGNTFDGLTVIAICGSQGFDIESNSGIVDIDAKSRFGKAGVEIEPGGRLNLHGAGNIPAGAMVALHSNPLALSVLGMTYNGLPDITKDSSGVIAIDAPAFDAITDLSKLGNGSMLLGSRDQGNFTGKTLAPGAGNVYRLGGGGFGGVWGRGWPGNTGPLKSGAVIGDFIAPDHWLRHNNSFMDPAGNPGSAVGGGMLTIDNGVLTGDAAVDVGSVQWLGNIGVVLKGANTFAGALSVQGTMQHGFQMGLSSRGSLLDGVAQTQAGQSPFGSPQGAVNLLNSTLQLTAIPNGQPVSKGEITFAGASTIALDANVDNLASLTVDKLTRQDRAMLVIDPQQEKLGDREQLIVNDWKKDVDLLPPWFLYSSTKNWAPMWNQKGSKIAVDRTTGPDFLAYDATGKKGVVRFTNYVADLATAKETDVVRSAPRKLPAGQYTVRALRTTGNITSKGASVKITSGGLILNGDFSPDIDFGSAEGIVYGSNLDAISNVQGMSVLQNVSGKISGTNGLTLLGGPLPWGYDFDVPALSGVDLTNPANNFTGMITVEGGTLQVLPDSLVKGAFVNGSLGDIHNPITLNGGILGQLVAVEAVGYLAPTHTVHLGPGGGYIHGNRGTWIFDAKITGPGFLNQTAEGAGTMIIRNPDNDYTGGTLVGWVMHVTPAGKLGDGPVMLAPGSILVLQGDHNCDPRFRLTASNSTIVSFESADPEIGSLDGSGLVWLGSDGSDYPRKIATATINLIVGGDNTDSTFYGTIRQGSGITGSLTKTGAGAFTLFGGHTYTGPTTVASGTLILTGSVAGDVIVNKGATFILKGTVGGQVKVADGGTFQNAQSAHP